MRFVLIASIVVVGTASAHPIHSVPGKNGSGYAYDSCTPHGLQVDALCKGVFSQCWCEWQASPDGAWSFCPGEALYPSPPAGTYVYHRLTTCSADLGPTFASPWFAPSPDQRGCGHVRITTSTTSGAAHVLEFLLFLVDGVLQHDWSHDCDPIADAGDAQTVCPGEVTTLDGGGSMDPSFAPPPGGNSLDWDNFDPLTWAWTQVTGPAVALSGTATAGATASGKWPPTSPVTTFIAPAQPGTSLTFQLTIKDTFGAPPEGTTTVGGVDRDDATVTVADGPPVVTTTDTTRFWPPNHKFMAFALRDCVTRIADTCDGELDVDEVGQIVDVTSSEPGDDFAVITGPTTVKLRAERDGGGHGRAYDIHFLVQDSIGNVTPATCRVTIPHDQR